MNNRLILDYFLFIPLLPIFHRQSPDIKFGLMARSPKRESLKYHPSSLKTSTVGYRPPHENATRNGPVPSGTADASASNSSLRL